MKCAAARHNLHYAAEGWSPAEEETLKVCWRHTSFRELQAAIPGRTNTALRRKAAKMGLGTRLVDMISEHQACVLLGVHVPEFRVLVELYPVHSLAVSNKRNIRLLKYSKTDVVAAAKDYFRRENTVHAGARLNVASQRLQRAAQTLGVSKLAGMYRLYPEEWDRLLERWEQYTANRHARAAEKRAARSTRSVSPATYTALRSSSSDTGSVPSTSSSSTPTTQEVAA